MTGQRLGKYDFRLVSSKGRHEKNAWMQSYLIILIDLFLVERRRRFNINDRIKELGTLLPKNNDP